jgi:thiol-disulfide isomerase/thioredoxin
VAGIAAAAGFAINRSATRAPVDTAASASAATALFALELPDTAGNMQAIGQWRGKVLVANFWATWCPPCRAEMPALEEVYQARRDEGLVVLAIDQNESPDSVKSFQAELGLTFPLLLDPGYTVSDQYRINLLPSTFFIGRDGVIRDVVFGGPMNRALLESKIESLLGAR